MLDVFSMKVNVQGIMLSIDFNCNMRKIFIGMCGRVGGKEVRVDGMACGSTMISFIM